MQNSFAPGSVLQTLQIYRQSPLTNVIPKAASVAVCTMENERLRAPISLSAFGRPVSLHQMYLCSFH